MKSPKPDIAEQIAQVASDYHKERTGHEPSEVTVIISENTLVVTLHGALTPAEQVMASTAEGARKVQEFHRELFIHSSKGLSEEIFRITGLKVREAAAEVEPRSGTVIHAFTTGTMVQVFQLHRKKESEAAVVN
jgi:uncharacterized protein YbcI